MCVSGDFSYIRSHIRTLISVSRAIATTIVLICKDYSHFITAAVCMCFCRNTAVKTLDNTLTYSFMASIYDRHVSLQMSMLFIN